MFIIEVGQRFINIKTGLVVEVTAVEGSEVYVLTILATGGAVNPRTMKTSSLHLSPTTARGSARLSGYIAVDALPEGHPLASVKEEKQAVPFGAPDFSAMSDEELSAYANARKAELALAEDLHEKAKKEIKLRRPNAGAYIVGNVYVGITTNIRFDAKVAKEVLTSTEYAAILKAKPDATLARELLSEKRYLQVCKNHGNKAEVRTATDEDRMKIAELEGIEKAKAEIDAFSLQDPFASV